MTKLITAFSKSKHFNKVAILFIVCYPAGNSFQFLVSNLADSFGDFQFLAATFAPASWCNLSVGLEAQN